MTQQPTCLVVDEFLGTADRESVLSAFEVLRKEELARRIGPTVAQTKVGFGYRYRGFPVYSAMAPEALRRVYRAAPALRGFQTFVRRLRRWTAEHSPMLGSRHAWELVSLTATSFSPSDRLPWHPDGQEDDWAVCYYPERRWSPRWGGQLVLGDGRRAALTVEPFGNRLVLFRVPRLHKIANVTVARRPRRAITGWLRRGA